MFCCRTRRATASAPPHRKEKESFCLSSKMTFFVIVYPKCFRGAVVFRFPLGTRSLLPANLKKLKESLNILFFTKRKKQCRLKSGGTVPIDMMFPPARRKRLVRSNLQSFEKPPQGSFPIYPAFPLAFGKVIDLAYCSTAIFALQERFANFSRYFLCYIRFLAPLAAIGFSPFRAPRHLHPAAFAGILCPEVRCI